MRCSDCKAVQFDGVDGILIEEEKIIPNKVDCHCCSELINKNEIKQLKCGHNYCFKCMKKLLKTALEIKHKPAKCKCKIEFDIEDIFEMVSEELFMKYTQSLTNNFLEYAQRAC